MNKIIYTLKEALCAFVVICLCTPICMAAECDALDVFEEIVPTQGVISCESFTLNVKKNTPAQGTLKFNSDNEVLFKIVDYPKKGNVVLTSENGDFVYTPFPEQTGEDKFSFRINANNEESNIALCTIQIDDENMVPSPSAFVYNDMRNHWCEYAAVKMVEKDIVKGERIGSDYYFYPDKKMTRIDALNLILSSLDNNTIKVDRSNTHIFKDSAALPDYINDVAYKAHRMGIIEGTLSDGDLYLRPYENITRAELIKMIDKAMNTKTRSSVNTNFTDFAIVPDWAKQSVINLVGYGIAKGFEDNTVRPYDNVTKAQTVQMLYQMVKYNEENGQAAMSEKVKENVYKQII